MPTPAPEPVPDPDAPRAEGLQVLRRFHYPLPACSSPAETANVPR